MTMGLRDDPGLLREAGGFRMIEIIRIREGVGEHEGGHQLAIMSDEVEEDLVAEAQRIVAEIHEHHLAAEDGGRGFGFAAAIRLDALERHALLAPELADSPRSPKERQTTRDAVALVGMERDRTAGTPHEVGRMGTDHERGLSCHDLLLAQAMLWPSHTERGTKRLPENRRRAVRKSAARSTTGPSAPMRTESSAVNSPDGCSIETRIGSPSGRRAMACGIDPGSTQAVATLTAPRTPMLRGRREG